MIYWHTIAGPPGAGLIEDGVMVETWDLDIPGRLFATVDTSHKKPVWFELGGTGELPPGLYQSGTEERELICSASAKCRDLTAFRDQEGNNHLVWVETSEVEEDVETLQSWSSLVGPATLARSKSGIEILDLQSRGGLPCVAWRPDIPWSKTRFSDQTTPESGSELPDGHISSPFLAGQTCFVYSAASERVSGSLELTIYQPDGSGNRQMKRSYRRAGELRADAVLSEGKRGDVRLFFSERQRGGSQILMDEVHGNKKEKVIYRATDGHRLQVIEAVASPVGPAAILFSESPEGRLGETTLKVAFEPTVSR